MKNISIYLAGYEEENQTSWDSKDKSFISNELNLFKISFLNSDFRLDDPISAFGRNMTQVYLSDFILLDARKQQEVGIGAEMMWAKIYCTPIITLAPINTHYHKDRDLVHPFLYSLSDVIVEDLTEASDWIRNYLLGKASPVKDIDFIQKCMQQYKKKQFGEDLPMQDLIEESPHLKDKFANIS